MGFVDDLKAILHRLAGPDGSLKAEIDEMGDDNKPADGKGKEGQSANK